jgi:hypothetical protein
MFLAVVIQRYNWFPIFQKLFLMNIRFKAFRKRSGKYYPCKRKPPQFNPGGANST